MARRVLFFSALIACVGCGGGSNVPATLRSQVQGDWRCDPQDAAMVGSTPTEQTWNVSACGRQLVMRCPAGGGRCEYGPAPATSVASSGAHGDIASAPPTEAPTEAPNEIPLDGTDPEAQLRAAIDARAPRVLRCTGGAITAVDLSWTIEGDVEIELTGAFTGTDAEVCAQDVLRGIPIPHGEAGHLRHPIRPR